MGTLCTIEQVVWMDQDAEDPRKRQSRTRGKDDDDDITNWTREYDVDQEIADHNQWWDSRFHQVDRICRGVDAAIVLCIWGCSAFYYWIWFQRSHHHDAANHHNTTTLHVVVVVSTALLGLLYCTRGLGVVGGGQVLTGILLSVQISLFIVLMMKRSFYVQQNHGIFLFHLLGSVSGTAIASELLRLVLITVMQRRRLRRDIDGLQEPLLDGVEWQMRQQEWASRTEEDPLWWSREEEEEEDGDETVYSRLGRHTSLS